MVAVPSLGDCRMIAGLEFLLLSIALSRRRWHAAAFQILNPPSLILIRLRSDDTKIERPSDEDIHGRSESSGHAILQLCHPYLEFHFSLPHPQACPRRRSWWMLRGTPMSIHACSCHTKHSIPLPKHAKPPPASHGSRYDL